MRRRFSWLTLIVLLLSGCKPSAVAMPQHIPPVTLPPEVLPHSGTPLPTIIIPETPTVTVTPAASSTATITPTFVIPSLTPYPDDTHFSIGQSVEGRDIWAWQFGSGLHTIVLIGG